MVFLMHACHDSQEVVGQKEGLRRGIPSPDPIIARRVDYSCRSTVWLAADHHQPSPSQLERQANILH